MRVLLPWSGHCSSDSDSESLSTIDYDLASASAKDDHSFSGVSKGSSNLLENSNQELPKSIFLKQVEPFKAEVDSKAPDVLAPPLKALQAASAQSPTKKTRRPETQESLQVNNHVGASKKRLRTSDSKPPAKPKGAMAIAGRFKNDSDEEQQDVLENTPTRIWIAENSPPPPLNKSNPVATDLLAVDERKQPPSLDSFCDTLKRQGLEMVEQEGDGNCLFRAVSLQVYGTADSHTELRERCMDFMSNNEEHYKDFVQGNFKEYIQRKRANGVHGNHAEIQAISELYKYVVCRFEWSILTNISESVVLLKYTKMMGHL